MVSTIVMPWWAWGYLFVVLTLFVAGLLADGEERSFNRIFSSAFSVFVMHIFVIGYFNQFVIDAIGYLIVPMFLIGVFWEHTRAQIETRRAKEELAKDTDLSEEESDLFLTIALGFNACVIVPGYAFGFLLCFRILGFL